MFNIVNDIRFWKFDVSRKNVQEAISLKNLGKSDSFFTAFITYASVSYRCNVLNEYGVFHNHYMFDVLSCTITLCMHSERNILVYQRSAFKILNVQYILEHISQQLRGKRYRETGSNIIKNGTGWPSITIIKSRHGSGSDLPQQILDGHR